MSTQDEHHRLMDELDEQQFPDATAFLRPLKPGNTPRQPWCRLSLTGAYDNGRTDVATRSAEILCDELGHRDPHSCDPRYAVIQLGHPPRGHGYRCPDR